MNNGASEYFKCMKPSEEERIQSVLPKPNYPLGNLMPISAIEAAKS